MQGSRLTFVILSALLCVHHAPALAQENAARAQAQPIDIAAHVREAAQRFGIPEHWIWAVIRIESAGRTHAVSSAGAMGLMQLMPGTWARQRTRFALGNDPFDPRNNIMAGASYLREMYDHYGAAGFLAAYNAGPGRYLEWLKEGRPLPLETRRYVARIAPFLQPERNFLEASLPPETGHPVALQRPFISTAFAADVADHDVPSNPFARPSVPAHDLFAPVATAGGR